MDKDLVDYFTNYMKKNPDSVKEAQELESKKSAESVDNQRLSRLSKRSGGHRPQTADLTREN